MAATYESIATTTLSTTAATVSFTSIAADWTDLVLIAVPKGTVSNTQWGLQFNSDTGSNYSQTSVAGSGTNATSGRNTSDTTIRTGNALSNAEFFNYIWHIQNYANSSTYKTVLGRANRADSSVVGNVGLWRSTSAITSVTLNANTYDAGNNFASGSTFTLYGIKAAI
jgi:hypothetical protein